MTPHRFGFAQHQVQRMKVAAIFIQQPADITVGGDFAPHGGFIQQGQFSMAVTVPQFLLVAQFRKLACTQRGKNTAGAIVTVDGILIDALTDDVRPFKHHAAEHISGLPSVAVFNHINIAAVRVDHLPAVTPAGAPADPCGLKHHHIVTGLTQI
ncbi:hypothetical protein SRABI106_01497 [Rahnella aquatilis]|nr:hypothetical protein SRABI106_01497 [Rahnella aquatilis]